MIHICIYKLRVLNVKRKHLQGEFTNFKAEIKLFSFVLTIFPLKAINPVLLATISLALCYFVVFSEVS